MDVRLSFFIIISSINLMCCKLPHSSIKSLYDNLLTNYSTHVRPLEDQNSTLKFYTHFNPLNLVQIDTALQKINMMGQFTFAWKDDFLTWNATEYHGANMVRLVAGDIWHPVVLLSAAYSGRISVTGHEGDKVTVSDKGNVRWTAEDVFELLCEMDITYYPFDSQECIVTIYISDESSKDVLLLPFEDTEKPRLRRELGNTEWKTLDSREEIYIVQNTQLLRYRFLFRRRPSFIMFTTVGPLLILAFLNSFVFLVPISSGEKGSIAITVFLSFSVYMSSIATVLPPNSLQTPILQVFMMILEVSSVLTMLYTIIESRLYNGTHNPFCCNLYPRKPRSDDGDGTVVNKRSSEDEFCSARRNSKNGFDRVDIKVCCFAVSLNVMIVVVFAYKIFAGTRDAF